MQMNQNLRMTLRCVDLDNQAKEQEMRASEQACRQNVQRVVLMPSVTLTGETLNDAKSIIK